jgi:hypothetical protein
MPVRHHRRDDGEAYALRFAKQRHKDKCRKNRTLQKNGNGQRAPLHQAFAGALFHIAVHKASA